MAFTTVRFLLPITKYRYSSKKSNSKHVSCKSNPKPYVLPLCMALLSVFVIVKSKYFLLDAITCRSLRIRIKKILRTRSRAEKKKGLLHVRRWLSLHTPWRVCQIILICMRTEQDRHPLLNGWDRLTMQEKSHQVDWHQLRPWSRACRRCPIPHKESTNELNFITQLLSTWPWVGCYLLPIWVDLGAN